MDQTKSEEQLMTQALNFIHTKEDLFKNVEKIQANISLIKFTVQDIKFDLSFNNGEGIKQAKVLQLIDENYPPFKYLFFIIKIFLSQRKLNNTFKGGIGSFLLQNMVYAFLKSLYLQFLQKGQEKQLSQINLSQYLIRFLKFYAGFDYRKKAIYVYQSDPVQPLVSEKESFNLFTANNKNIGQKAFNFKVIFNAFKNRHQCLTNQVFRDEESALKYLINPSGHKFSELLN